MFFMNKFNSKDVSNVTRIQGTNDNSILSKCSMIKYGYFDDEFLPYMISKFSRRAPLINRGYYIRAKAVESILMNFIEYHKNKDSIQIVSLGAGFDTSFFRLTNQGKLDNCTFVEVDYFDVAQRKAVLMQQAPKLWSLLRSTENSVSLQKDNYIVINTPNYKLIGIDLTKLDILDACIRASGVSYDLPTLFLSECVITYINTKKSTSLLNFIAKSFQENCFVLYEQVYPDDNFGKFMCQHFKQLGSSLRGIQTFKTKKDQIERFLKAGWDCASGCDMSEFYYNIIGSSEKSRIENLEVFDEYEEWLLKCNHYMILVASKNMSWDPRISAETNTCHHANANNNNNNNDNDNNGEPTPAHCTLPLIIQPYTSDDTEIFKYGGIKTHYVKANLIYSSADNQHEYLMRASGYGQNPFSSGHCRLTCVSILDLVTNTMTHIEPIRSELLLSSLCGTMTEISRNKYIILGGRSSPLKPNNIVTILSLCYDQFNGKWGAECTELISVDESHKPSPRWRHISAIYWIYEKSYLFVYGGRNSNPYPLSDTYKLDICEQSWHQIHNESPGPLISASVVSIGSESNCDNSSSDKCCGCCCLLVLGGLIGSDLIPSNNLWRWCGRTEQWTSIGNANFVPRFSHSSHIVNRSHKCNARTITIAAVGGVSHKTPNCGASFITIDLITNEARCVDATIDSNNTNNDNVECVMLHNHGSTFSSISKKIYICGGGGNCFSFGTQLNENVYSIDLSQQEFL